MTSLDGYVSPGHGGKAGHRPARRHTMANGSRTGTGRCASPARRASPRPTGNGAHYCPMLAVDIKAFNDPKRGEDVQRFLRAAMYELLTSAFACSRLAWLACHHEDRGDGVLVVAPPSAPAAALIDPLVDHLRAGIRLHNKICSDVAKIRLRMSVHAGQVHFDGNGVCGLAVTHLFRMLEAAAFKRAFAASGADFALVTSDALYEEVISHGPGLIDPDMYAPITIRCKETRGRAWLYLPPGAQSLSRQREQQRAQARRSASAGNTAAGRGGQRRPPNEPARADPPPAVAAACRMHGEGPGARTRRAHRGKRRDQVAMARERAKECSRPRPDSADAFIPATVTQRLATRRRASPADSTASGTDQRGGRNGCARHGSGDQDK